MRVCPGYCAEVSTVLASTSSSTTANACLAPLPSPPQSARGPQRRRRLVPHLLLSPDPRQPELHPVRAGTHNVPPLPPPQPPIVAPSAPPLPLECGKADGTWAGEPSSRRQPPVAPPLAQSRIFRACPSCRTAEPSNAGARGGGQGKVRGGRSPGRGSCRSGCMRSRVRRRKENRQPRCGRGAAAAAAGRQSTRRQPARHNTRHATWMHMRAHQRGHRYARVRYTPAAPEEVEEAEHLYHSQQPPPAPLPCNNLEPCTPAVRGSLLLLLASTVLPYWRDVSHPRNTPARNNQPAHRRPALENAPATRSKK